MSSLRSNEIQLHRSVVDNRIAIADSTLHHSVTYLEDKLNTWLPGLVRLNRQKLDSMSFHTYGYLICT